MFTIFRLSPKKKKHLKGLLRVAGYVTVLGMVTGGLQIRAARAELKDRSIQVGRQMFELAKASQHDVSKITMNGQAMFIGSSLSHDTVANVLSRYEGHCKTHASQETNGWKELADKVPDDGDIDKSFMSNGLLRGGDDDEGAILCFTKSDRSKASVKDALIAFGETGELSTIGSLRYVYAHKTERGNTVVLAAWTDEKFNVRDLMPEEGQESPGEDLPEIPRPNDSTRILTTRLEGTPYGLNVYRTNSSVGKVMDQYDAQMQERGWLVFDPQYEKNPNNGGDDGTRGRLFEKDGVVLTLAANVQQGATYAALGLAGVGSIDKLDTAAARKAH